MKFSRNASANWKGTGLEGAGSVSTQSKVLDETQLSFKTRFENGIGTNPEELVGAAHAGCFTMQLSFLISEAGYVPGNLDTQAKVFFEDGTITKIELDLKGKVPELSKDEFLALADKAKQICPISKLLDTDIQLSAEFIS